MLDLDNLVFSVVCVVKNCLVSLIKEVVLKWYCEDSCCKCLVVVVCNLDCCCL